MSSVLLCHESKFMQLGRTAQNCPKWAKNLPVLTQKSAQHCPTLPRMEQKPNKKFGKHWEDFFQKWAVFLKKWADFGNFLKTCGKLLYFANCNRVYFILNKFFNRGKGVVVSHLKPLLNVRVTHPTLGFLPQLKNAKYRTNTEQSSHSSRK